MTSEIAWLKCLDYQAYTYYKCGGFVSACIVKFAYHTYMYIHVYACAYVCVRFIRISSKNASIPSSVCMHIHVHVGRYTCTFT